MKTITILGSTGSIGTQALEIIRNNRDRFSVSALTCRSRKDDLIGQIREFGPQAVSVGSAEDAAAVQAEFPQLTVYYGEQGLIEIAKMDCDIVLNSLMGISGLAPTYTAIGLGRDIALANKETLVAGGAIVTQLCREKGSRLLPVDSEHSAIFQCLEGNGGSACARAYADPDSSLYRPVRRILLTASGGPFRGYSRSKLEKVTLAQALKHPNWSMGDKITVDSATMMNKGLEIIEAKWLFDVPLEQIQVLIHPQSILHSAVEFEDGSVIGQMGNPDMKVPIAYAFSYPERINLLLDGTVEPLNLFALEEGMTFYPADESVFKTIALARQACKRGGTVPVVLNGANEVLVDMFLHKKIRFTDIQDTLERLLDDYIGKFGLDLEGILEEDKWIREHVSDYLEGSKG